MKRSGLVSESVLDEIETPGLSDTQEMEERKRKKRNDGMPMLETDFIKRNIEV